MVIFGETFSNITPNVVADVYTRQSLVKIVNPFTLSQIGEVS